MPVLKQALATFAACVLVLAGPARPALGGTDTTTQQPKAKPSSLAPHPTAKRTFGAPVQPPILHKRHKQGARAMGNQATASHSSKPGEAPK
jgi:hypothetical protein